MQQAMIQTVLVPLDKLPEGFASTSQALINQSLVRWSVHDHPFSDARSRWKVPGIAQSGLGSLSPKLGIVQIMPVVRPLRQRAAD